MPWKSVYSMHPHEPSCPEKTSTPTLPDSERVHGLTQQDACFLLAHHQCISYGIAVHLSPPHLHKAQAHPPTNSVELFLPGQQLAYLPPLAPSPSLDAVEQDSSRLPCRRNRPKTSWIRITRTRAIQGRAPSNRACKSLASTSRGAST